MWDIEGRVVDPRRQRAIRYGVPAGLIDRISAYYAAGNYAGGSLHIVLDDGNVEAEFVQYCREFATEQGDTEGVALADELLRLTDKQRLALYRMSFYP